MNFGHAYKKTGNFWQAKKLSEKLQNLFKKKTIIIYSMMEKIKND